MCCGRILKALFKGNIEVLSKFSWQIDSFFSLSLFVSAEKYCDLLEEEGGLLLLEELCHDPRPIEEIRLLANQIINFIKHRKSVCQGDNQINGGLNENVDDALDG